MKLKHKLILTYLIFGVMFALYVWMYGDTAHKSFAYNLGQGLVWPAVMFPVLGKIVGAIILVVFIAIISIS